MSAQISELDTGRMAPAEVAFRLRTSVSAVYQALRGPLLTGYRRGRRVVIRDEDFLAYLAHRYAAGLQKRAVRP